MLPLFIFLISLQLKSPAQEILSQPMARRLTRIPFRLFSGSVMVVNATLENHKDSLNFILDTGSGGISLDSLTAVELNIPNRLTDTTITGIGGIKKVNFAFDKSLHFPGLTINNLNFHINNYEVLSSVYGERIDGIIGYSFFSRYIVQINFDSLFIDIYVPGKFAYPSRGFLMSPVFTSLPIVSMEVRDKKKLSNHFYFDTGAGLCLLMSEKFANDSGILLSKRKPVITQAEGMLGRLVMRQTLVKEVKLGPYRFHQVPTYLYDDVYNVTSYPFAGGLLGNELLRRFNITVNYPQRQIYLLPNSHFFEPFDYSYTGLGMYFLKGKIIIGDIIKASPAFRAGLKEGDEIISINNNLSRNVLIYKNMLQVAYESFKLIIMRDNKLLEKTLFTGRIK